MRRRLAAKAQIVVDALARIGGIRSLPHPIEVVASPEQLRYRNRASFTLRRRGEGDVVAGFHGVDAPGRVVDVDGALPSPRRADRSCLGGAARRVGSKRSLSPRR